MTNVTGTSGITGLGIQAQTIDMGGNDIDMKTTGARIDLDTDNDTSIRASADDVITFERAGADSYRMGTDGLEILVAAKSLYLSATAGGSGGVTYKDAGSVARFGLLFPGSDIVALANRASNGLVEIRANTSTAGSGGEVTVLTVSDTDLTFADAKNIIFNATTGTEIGTASTQKLSFYGATPVVQPGHIADATDAASVITQLNLLLADMAELGLQAAA